MLGRRISFWKLWAAAIAAAVLVPAYSLHALEVVTFESAAFTYAPSPFKVRQAKKKGITLEPKIEASVPLRGS